MQDLKTRVLRGGIAKLAALAVNFLLRIASTMVLARLLDPKDFGLVSIATMFTGILSLFRDFGLSSATVQRLTINNEQMSTLFWVNLLLGLILGLMTFSMAPVLATFFHDSDLLMITTVLASVFVLNAAGIQHSAILQRQMRFATLSSIGVASAIASTAAGIGAAELGFGYWALVVMSITGSIVTTSGFWASTRWVPGWPRDWAGIRAMMHFGGTLTLNGLVAYVAFNAEKAMIGRVWGADAVGIYGRAYQLISIPTDNFNSAVGEVAFSALSRLQDDPARLRSYFLKGFSLVIGLTLPVTIACALFADDIVVCLLGSKWHASIDVVRLLAPTIAITALINPLGWLIYSMGLVARGLRIALVFAPIVIAGYAIGLPYGPKGVAAAYSTVMTLWLIPHIAWCLHGTAISLKDIAVAVSRPVASGVAAGLLAFGARLIYGSVLSAWLRLFLENGVLFIAFFSCLLLVAGQKSLYADLLTALRRGPVAASAETAAP